MYDRTRDYVDLDQGRGRTNRTHASLAAIANADQAAPSMRRVGLRARPVQGTEQLPPDSRSVCVDRPCVASEM